MLGDWFEGITSEGTLGKVLLPQVLNDVPGDEDMPTVSEDNVNVH